MCDWDDDSEDGQRMKNLLFYKMYATDNEIDEMFSSPSFWITLIGIIIFLVVLIY